MADVPGGEGGGGGGRHQKKRAKKGNTRIDMTPMVDLAFLLLTFFILTTTMYKPSTLQLSFPVPPEPDQPPPELDKVNNALTLFLTKKDAIYYYKDAFKEGETQLTASNFKDIEKVLIELNKPTIEKINELAKQLNENKITEEVFDSLKNVEQGRKEALFVIIKPDVDARYRNMIDIVDEMDITGVGKYAVQDTIKAVEQALLDIEKAKI